MTHSYRLCAFVALLCSGSSLIAAPERSAFPEPPVPDEIASAGEVYHALHDREAQVVFSSETPFENIVGKSNSVVGYVVAGPREHPADLAGAHWILPVESLATGIPLRDHHIAGGDWLDAEDYPTIEFVLDRVEEVELVKRGDGFSTWAVTLVGTMNMHGKSREMRVPETRLSFLKGSEKTASIAPGDLVFMKSTYSVKLSDYGISNADVPDKVADQIKLNQTLRMTSELLEKTP